MIDSTLSRFGSNTAPRTSSSLPFPAFGLLLIGLLANLSSRDEVYANLEYGFSALALFGAAGCIGHLAASLYRRSGTLDFAFSASIQDSPEAVVPGGILGGTGEWPVLVALLLGPLVFLLSGLGGWV